MAATLRGKRKPNANSQMQNCVIAVAVFLLILALVNVLLLHSHMHRYSSNLDVLSQSVARKATKTVAVSVQSLLEANNITSFSHADIQACPSLPQAACSETKYTILAVCSDGHLPHLIQKVLQWMHDPWVHQIVLLFPSSSQAILEEDLHYGVRLLHWNEQHAIQIMFGDVLVNALLPLSVSTEALVWVSQPHALIPNRMIRDALGRWKSDSSRTVTVSNSVTAQWFVLHRGWLCALKTLTNRSSDAWDTKPFHDLFSLISTQPEASSRNTC